MGEVKFGKQGHWNIFYAEKGVIAIAYAGEKTLLVYLNEKENGIQSSVQIVDSKNNGYFTRVENDKLVEIYLKDDKQLKSPATKNNLKEYMPILYTLPKNIKDAINPLLL
jgi:hypothetical protein